MSTATDAHADAIRRARRMAVKLSKILADLEAEIDPEGQHEPAQAVKRHYAAITGDSLFPVRLRDARQAAGWTSYAKAAQAAGLHEQTFGGYERGTIKPSPEALADAVASLGLDWRSLMPPR